MTISEEVRKSLTVKKIKNKKISISYVWKRQCVFRQDKCLWNRFNWSRCLGFTARILKTKGCVSRAAARIISCRLHTLVAETDEPAGKIIGRDNGLRKTDGNCGWGGRFVTAAWETVKQRGEESWGGGGIRSARLMMRCVTTSLDGETGWRLDRQRQLERWVLKACRKHNCSVQLTNLSTERFSRS